MSFEIDWEQIGRNFKVATQDKNGEIWAWDHHPVPESYRWMPDWKLNPNAESFKNFIKVSDIFTKTHDNYDWDSFVLVRDKPVGHPHAALMAEYAKDALTSKEPWKNWEHRDAPSAWFACNSSPAWNSARQYRRKVKKISVEIPLDAVVRFSKEPHFISSGDLTLFREICKEALEKSQ